MTKDLSNHYYRQLRDLYSVELQIISLIPELGSQSGSGRFSSLVDEARTRRDVLEMIAADHDISSAGDDCTTMRTLGRQARASLAECDDDQACREQVAAAACERIRRHTHSGYKVISLLAEQLDLPVDAARLRKVLNQSFSVVEFPAPARSNRSSRQQLLSA